MEGWRPSPAGIRASSLLGTCGCEGGWAGSKPGCPRSQNRLILRSSHRPGRVWCPWSADGRTPEAGGRPGDSCLLVRSVCLLQLTGLTQMDRPLEKLDFQEAATNLFPGVCKFGSREKPQTSDVFILYYSYRRWHRVSHVEGHTGTPLSWVLWVGLGQPHLDQSLSTTCGCFPKDHVPGGKGPGPRPPLPSQVPEPAGRPQPPGSSRSVLRRLWSVLPRTRDCELLPKSTLSVESRMKKKEGVITSRSLQNKRASVWSASQKPLVPAEMLFSESGEDHVGL